MLEKDPGGPVPSVGNCTSLCFTGLYGVIPPHFFLMCSGKDQHESLGSLSMGKHMREGLRGEAEYEKSLPHGGLSTHTQQECSLQPFF